MALHSPSSQRGHSPQNLIESLGFTPADIHSGVFHQSIDSVTSITVQVSPTRLEMLCLCPYNETIPRRHYNSYELGDCGLAIAMTSPKRPIEKDGLVLLGDCGLAIAMTSPKRPIEEDGLVLLGRVCSVLNYPCKMAQLSLLTNHYKGVTVKSQKVRGRHYGCQYSRPCADEYCKTETTKVHITSQRVCISSLLVYRIRDVPPTICLDHRPEPALLGKVRSVLRNLKFPSMKLVSLQSSSPTTKSMYPANLITSERVLPPQPLPNLSKADFLPNLLATNLITNVKVLPPRSPPGHTSTLGLAYHHDNQVAKAVKMFKKATRAKHSSNDTDSINDAHVPGEEKSVSTESGTTSSTNNSSAGAHDIVFVDSRTTESRSPNFSTSNGIHSSQSPSHTSSLPKMVNVSPPNLLATDLITSERILPPRSPLGHTSSLPKVVDASQSIFGPIKEAAAALHVGNYMNMFQCLLLDDLSELAPQERIAVIFGKGVALFKRANLRDAAEMFIQCEKEAESAGFQADAAICHVYLGDIHFARQDYPKAVKHYTKAVTLYHPICIAAGWYGMSIPTVSSIYAKCGSAYHNVHHEVANAVEMYKKAIDCAHPLSQDKRSAHTSLGNLYQSLGDNNSALTEYKESIRLAKELGDFVSLSWAHGNMGNAYLGLFQKDKALHHLEKSLELALDHEPIP